MGNQIKTMTTTAKRNPLTEWINENNTFHSDRYMDIQIAQKHNEDISKLKEKEQKQAEAISKNSQVYLNRLEKGTTHPCVDMDNKREAYKHPVHRNEALYLSDDLEKVPHFIRDCYGDWYLFSSLEEALTEFLSPAGHHMWVEALAAGHHSDQDIWL
jgi:hypothetical protein